MGWRPLAEWSICGACRQDWLRGTLLAQLLCAAAVVNALMRNSLNQPTREQTPLASGLAAGQIATYLRHSCAPCRRQEAATLLSRRFSLDLRVMRSASRGEKRAETETRQIICSAQKPRARRPRERGRDRFHSVDKPPAYVSSLPHCWLLKGNKA